MNKQLTAKSRQKSQVLGLLEYLPVIGEANRKEGVYTTFVKVHAEIGVEFVLALLRTGDYGKQKDFCSRHGVSLLPHNTSHRFPTFLKYLDISYKHCNKKSFFSWFSFIWKNQGLLSSIDEHITIAGRPDAVSSLTSLEFSGRIAFLVSKRYNVPFLSRENRTYYTRGLIKGKFKRVLADVVNSAHTLLPVSSQLGENIKDQFQVDIKNVTTLHNAIADDFFCPPKDRKWVEEFAQGRFVFAGWTKWRDIKRPDIAVEAFAEAIKQIPESCLIISGPVTPGIEELIEASGIRDSVLLTGPLDRAGIHCLAHGCHCCIVTSDHDPGNNSVLEAMAAGKPVVVTRCGGSESRIREESLGRIVDKGDVKAFSAAMIDIYNNIEIFDSDYIIRECRRWYSEKALKNTLMSVYNAIINK